ncbi:fatty acid-binding protein, liver-like [Acanthaster planci]|uniref:Fatty acid-binding protein, liver-like n=1 Tax=Acanthaster planci TaxID=133434 RepID=A0A8B7Z4E2_ACAPL|nr:fatty acid-binding protein, liver-like [Acanthaster planci]XP_022099656.1 fatty acid-binding protein, liver-like [Acanthaster planci]
MSGKGGVNFSGKWELVSSEKYLEWLEAMGLPEAERQRGLANTPSLEIIHEGDAFDYVSRKGGIVKKVSQKIGEEYLDQAHGLSEMRVPHWEGDKLVICAASNPPGQWTTTCQLDGDRLLLCYISHHDGKDGVTAKRWFARIGDPDAIV